MTRVDVVVPAYNADAYLREALESVFVQGPLVGKVIVVDDGSSDGTATVVAAQGDAVEFIQLQGNHGPAAARNAGLAQCAAEFVAFLDADDRWLPGKLDAQVEALVAAPNCGLAICQVRPFADKELPAAEREALLAQQPAEMEGWLASALVARRSLFTQAGVFSEDLRLGDVIDWFNRVRPYGHVAIPAVLVERRMHRTNMSRREVEQRRGYLIAAQRHLARQRAPGGGG
jgi:glycosyltransferase involved in cell wall biosynthesis